MATYNGVSYVETQLKSILCQLARDDELILVDDHSQDLTVDLIKSLGDTRIKIYQNKCNEGVLKTFERAIRLSSGDVIFLSDQDDVWYPKKVARISDVFRHQPDVTLVMSDANYIDDKGKVFHSSFVALRGGFKGGLLPNIIKNRYLGCSLAFRRTIVNKFLPFPPDIPMHDVWIGCINAIYG